MSCGKKLAVDIFLSLIATALTPPLVSNFVGYVYGKLIMGKGSAMAEFIMGWVAGLWLAPVVLVLGIFVSIKKYKKWQSEKC